MITLGLRAQTGFTRQPLAELREMCALPEGSTPHETKNEFTFNDFYLLYRCPLCGGPQNLEGFGQALIWIVLECISKGEAISHCDSCGQQFKMPAAIFADKILRKLGKLARKNYDGLHACIKTEFVDTHTQPKMLRSDWYDILLKANANGPVDTMAMPWEPKEECPHCGRRPSQFGIGFRYACPGCQHELGFSQEDVHPRLGVQVICRYCWKPHFVPSTVRCPTCQRSLLHYYDVLRSIADANGIDFKQLLIRK